MQGRAEVEIEFMESSLSEEHASYRYFFLFGFVVLLVGGGWILLSGRKWPGEAHARALCWTGLLAISEACVSPRGPRSHQQKLYQLPADDTASSARN